MLISDDKNDKDLTNQRFCLKSRRQSVDFAASVQYSYNIGDLV